MLITTYYGLFPNGMIVEKPTLNELNQVAGIKHLLKYQKNSEQGNHWSLLTYINTEGIQTNLRIGNFEIVDIVKEQTFGRYIIYKDVRSGNMRRIESKAYLYDLLFRDAIPLLDKLNEIGSFEMYDKLIELDKLKVENQTLKQQVQTLTKQLETVKANA